MIVLVEIYILKELDWVLVIEGVKLIGINNCNLGDFLVDL